MRILLAGMSNMLSSIITAALSQAPDIVVAGQVGKDADLNLEIRLARADAVILQTSRPAVAERFMRLLRSFPTLKVVAIDGTSGGGFVHQLRPNLIYFPELSADLLQSALRGSVIVRCGEPSLSTVER